MIGKPTLRNQILSRLSDEVDGNRLFIRHASRFLKSTPGALDQIELGRRVRESRKFKEKHPTLEDYLRTVDYSGSAKDAVSLYDSLTLHSDLMGQCERCGCNHANIAKLVKAETTKDRINELGHKYTFTSELVKANVLRLVDAAAFAYRTIVLTTADSCQREGQDYSEVFMEQSEVRPWSAVTVTAEELEKELLHIRDNVNVGTKSNDVLKQMLYAARSLQKEMAEPKPAPEPEPTQKTETELKCDLDKVFAINAALLSTPGVFPSVLVGSGECVIKKATIGDVQCVPVGPVGNMTRRVLEDGGFMHQVTENLPTKAALVSQDGRVTYASGYEVPAPGEDWKLIAQLNEEATRAGIMVKCNHIRMGIDPSAKPVTVHVHNVKIDPGALAALAGGFHTGGAVAGQPQAPQPLEVGKVLTREQFNAIEADLALADYVKRKLVQYERRETVPIKRHEVQQITDGTTIGFNDLPATERHNKTQDAMLGATIRQMAEKTRSAWLGVPTKMVERFPLK